MRARARARARVRERERERENKLCKCAALIILSLPFFCLFFCLFVCLVEVRFVKGDDIYLSPCHGQDTCYINIISYRSVCD